MRTIQMTLDDDLVEDVDRVSKRLNTSRSAFTRKALRDALVHHRIKEMEHKHSQGYKQHPVGSDEFSVWEDEQEWGDFSTLITSLPSEKMFSIGKAMRFALDI